MKRLLAFIGGLAAVVAGAPASAQDFYQGKTIRVIVGSGAGDGYDTIARTVMRHMTRHIPGNPNVVVVNMPGAGGLVAANHLANVAEQDGTVIGMANRFAPMTAVLGEPQAKFKADAFQWLGTTASYSDNAYLFVIRSALPFRTVDDLRKVEKPLIVGESGSDVPAVLREALGIKINIVTGYKTSSELELAFERGEVDAHTTGYASILQRHQRWLDTGMIRSMIQFGRVTRLPILADVPTARELARTEEERKLIEFAELPLLMARPMVAPPGVPKDRVELLRAAFMKTVADPAYIEDGIKQKHELTPASGAEVQNIIGIMTSSPKAVLDRYTKAVGGKAPG